jgi:hypothetical protein
MEYDGGIVESGGRTDFLAPSGSIPTYRPAHVDRVLHEAGDEAESNKEFSRQQVAPIP